MICVPQTLHPQRRSAKAQMKSSCPASLDTLKISVPPAVKLDVACAARPALDLNDSDGFGRGVGDRSQQILTGEVCGFLGTMAWREHRLRNENEVRVGLP